MVITIGGAIGLLLLNASPISPFGWPLTAFLAAVTTAALVPRWMTVASLIYTPGRGPLSPSGLALIEYREGT